MNRLCLPMVLAGLLLLAATAGAAETAGETWQGPGGGGACGRASGDYNDVFSYSDDTVSFANPVSFDANGQVSVSHCLVVRTPAGVVGTKCHVNQGPYYGSSGGGWGEALGRCATLRLGGTVSPCAAWTFTRGNGTMVRTVNYAQSRSYWALAFRLAIMSPCWLAIPGRHGGFLRRRGPCPTTISFA